ncbi:RDD family protein [Paenibacillus sp. P25]|nr:RDD family protein [Paenibacillus sp. P25]
MRTWILSRKGSAIPAAASPSCWTGLLLLPVLLLLGALQLPAAYFLVTAVYFIAVPYITNGRTLGKGIVRIRIAGGGPRLRLREILVRSGSLYLLLGGLHALYVMAAVRALPEELLAVLAVVVFFADAWFALHLFVRLFNRSKKLFYEELSGTAHVIT